MKLNKFLMALAATAIVGCTSEDLNDFGAKQAPEDSRLIELNSNFVLAGVGEEASGTRTHWDMVGGSLTNKFLPIWATAPTGGNKIYDDGVTSKDADLLQQAVGLCWLGQGTVGTDVYTNYQFYHFGWLKTGETEAKFECDALTNGAMYDQITVAAGDAAGAEADETKFTVPAEVSPLNYNSGIYKTDNKAIFGGQYIVYYPFNEDFKEVGTIPAKAITAFDKVAQSYNDAKVGHATFRYSAPVTIKGGDQAGGFGLYNLSTLVQLRVSSPATTACSKTIDKIVLYSASGKLLKQANLAADQIVAGKKGTELYAETEGTRVITATFTAPVAVKKTNGTGADKPISAYITVLPTTVDDLAILVHSNDGKWATVNKPGTVFDAGAARKIDITVVDADFKADFIALDEESLRQARDEARTAGGKPVITVIGDITLDKTKSPYDFYSNAVDKDITIKGDAIIVPEDVVLNVGTKIQSDIRILGKGCCGAALTGGRLNIKGKTELGNVTMVPTEKKELTPAQYVDYNPYVTYDAGTTTTIAAGKTFNAQDGTVDVKGTVQHKGNINIAEKVKLTVSGTGDLNFMGSTVVNDGTIEVEKAGKFDITDKDGNASATDGKNMTNNGTFIHNVDAAVGTAVQLMNQNGEYRCKVDKQIKLDDAYQKWTACSVIEMVDAGQAYNLGVAEKNIEYKHNGKFIDIEVNTTSLTTFNNPADGEGNGDNKNIQVGKLTVMQGGLYVPFVTGEGKRELTVNGDMTVSAKSSLYSSKKITVKENLKVEGAELIYCGKKQNEGGLAVTKDITVSGAAGIFNADGIDALDITCANFTLADGATAKFGNRTNGDTKNLTVSGTISNPDGCTFNIHAANQEAGSVLATITCTKLMVGGAFPGGKPQVVAAE